MTLQANHWRVNGRINSRLEQASERPPWISRGEEKKGPENRAAVVLLQQALVLAGYSIPAGPTGVYGDQTAAAVRALQADPVNNLSPDSGIAGREVLAVLDRKLLALETPVTPYWLTSPQYAALIAEVRSRYRNSPRLLGNASALSELVHNDYPGFAGIHVSLSYAQIRELYIPPDWLQSQAETWREAVRVEGEAALRQGSWRRLRDLPPAPPFDPAIARFLADLDTLRSSPVAALIFIDLTGKGADTSEAMDWARFGAHFAQLMTMTGRGMVATRRATGSWGMAWDEGLAAGRPVTRPRAVQQTQPRPTNSPETWNQMPLGSPPPFPQRPASPPGTVYLYTLPPAQIRRLLKERFNRAAPARSGQEGWL